MVFYTYLFDIHNVVVVDISKNKVGKNISEAIQENEFNRMVNFIKDSNVQVVMGNIFDV